MWGSHQGVSEYSTAWGAFAANGVAFWYVDGLPLCRDCKSMIPKSGNRFSDKIMLKQKF